MQHFRQHIQAKMISFESRTALPLRKCNAVTWFPCCLYEQVSHSGFSSYHAGGALLMLGTAVPCHGRCGMMGRLAQAGGTSGL